MSGEKIRLLHIDDEPAELKLVEVMISLQEDFSYVGGLLTANNVAEEVLRTNPDVVLMDMRMEGRDPLEAIRDLSSQFADLRIVAYTGFDDPELRERVLAAGAWGFVRKSLDLTRTLAAMAQALRQGQPRFCER